MTQNSKFDASKYQVSVEAKPITIKIPETGEEFEITVKQLSWTKRNHLLSKCFAWDGKTKENKFDGNFYIKECIKEIWLGNVGRKEHFFHIPYGEAELVNLKDNV